MKHTLLKMNLQTFARAKNAARLHHIMEWTDTEEVPAASAEGWLRLAKFISTIGDDTDEATEDEGFYDGDGTTETTVTGVAGAYSPEGYFDPEDPAQALIASKKYEIGDGRKVWHKVTMTNGDIYIQRATLTDIVAGAGDAVEFEDFSCTIRFDRIPVKTPAAGAGLSTQIQEG